ncbi:MAG TPA: hypothetical protein VN668_21915 [Stellaceae bacterium]|nr:hypothetical protein [Stellaceae bacterium]
MTDTVLPAEPPKLRVGAVFNRAFSLLFGDFLKFFLLALLAWVPLLVALLIVGFRFARVGPNGFPGPSGVFVTGAIVVSILTGFCVVLSQAVILYGAFERMRGKAFALGESVKRGVARVLPIFGMYILMGLAVGIGFALVIVPGLILAAMFSVALPACVVEKLGPFDSLIRSVELTKGNRWRVFGIVIVLYVANVLGQALVRFLLLAIGGPALSGIGAFLWTVLMGAYWAIAVAVIYHDLRAAREGVDIERIAAVFD